MDHIRREFLADADELLEQIFTNIDHLREKHDEGKSRRELVDHLFRSVHSLKGSASSAGLYFVRETAHDFEALLDALRSGRVRVNTLSLDACERAANMLSESLSLEMSRVSVSEQLKTLDADDPEFRPSSTDGVLTALPSEIWQSLATDERHHLSEVVEEGAHLFLVSASFDITDFDKQFSQLKEKLATHGEVISTSPTLVSDQPDTINFRLLYASDSDVPQSGGHLYGLPHLSIAEISASLPRSQSSIVSQPRIRPLTAKASTTPDFVRTDLDHVDRLISSTHQLFRRTTQTLELALRDGSEEIDKEALEQLNRQVRHSFMSLEKEIISLRMVSLKRTLQRAARAGRMAARLANKEVDFVLCGLDLRIDKLLCDGIADPLLHLVRNAVDHGIESSEERIRAGKKGRGLVRIEATNEGSQTRVTVSDDGRGIDPQLVTRVATKMGIIDPNIILDIDWSLRLIFRPGFSTVTEVSTVSGRGVGLDAVESGVEQVGGEVRVSSQPGKGTAFEVRLPVTFGLLRCGVLESGMNFYCLNEEQVIDRLTVKTNEIAKNNEREELRRGRDSLPLYRLNALLGQSSCNSPDEILNVLICRYSEEGSLSGSENFRRIALVAEGTRESQEVLVRSLGSHAVRWEGIAGAAELQDGTVALVLDLPRLING